MTPEHQDKRKFLVEKWFPESFSDMYRIHISTLQRNHAKVMDEYSGLDGADLTLYKIFALPTPLELAMNRNEPRLKFLQSLEEKAMAALAEIYPDDEKRNFQNARKASNLFKLQTMLPYSYNDPMGVGMLDKLDLIKSQTNEVGAKYLEMEYRIFAQGIFEIQLSEVQKMKTVFEQKDQAKYTHHEGIEEKLKVLLLVNLDEIENMMEVTVNMTGEDYMTLLKFSGLSARKFCHLLHGEKMQVSHLTYLHHLRHNEIDDMVENGNAYIEFSQKYKLINRVTFMSHAACAFEMTRVAINCEVDRDLALKNYNMAVEILNNFKDEISLPAEMDAFNCICTYVRFLECDLLALYMAKFFENFFRTHSQDDLSDVAKTFLAFDTTIAQANERLKYYKVDKNYLALIAQYYSVATRCIDKIFAVPGPSTS